MFNSQKSGVGSCWHCFSCFNNVTRDPGCVKSEAHDFPSFSPFLPFSLPSFLLSPHGHKMAAAAPDITSANKAIRSVRSHVSHIPPSPPFFFFPKSKRLFRATWSSVFIGFHGSELDHMAPLTAGGTEELGNSFVTIVLIISHHLGLGVLRP